MTVTTEVDHLGPGRLMTVIGNGPPWTMTSDGCDYEGEPPSTMTSDDCDYGSGPPWTLTSDDCDYGMDHFGPGSLMTVITEWMDHPGP